MKKSRLLLCALVLPLLFASCEQEPAEPEVTLSSIKVTKNPSKVSYTEGEVFDPKGMEITATYSDESTAPVTDYTYSPTEALTLGTKAVSISFTYKEVTKNTSVAITVNEKDSLVSITVTTPPSKTEYLDGDTFDATDMVVSAKFKIAGTKTIDDYTVAPEKLTYTDKSVTITYVSDGVTKTVEQAITVKPVLTSINVTAQPTKTQYNEDEKFDPAGMVVKASFSNNKSEEIFDYTYKPTRKLKPADKAVTITYKKDGIEKTTEVQITVIPAETHETPDMTFDCEAAKANYSSESFSISGGTYTQEGNIISLTPSKEKTKYTITGYFNGQIKIDNEFGKNTQLKLDNAYIENTDGLPAIFSSKKIEISTESETVNYIVSSGTSSEKPGAILTYDSEKDDTKDIELGGSGTCYIAGNVCHGIKGHDIKAKGSGTYYIQATSDGSCFNCKNFLIESEKSVILCLLNSKNGIKADETISISSGTVYLLSTATGLKTDTSKDDPDAEHFIKLENCSLYTKNVSTVYKTEKDGYTEENVKQGEF